MHGRLKVKTTAEQKKAKLEEKERKFKEFRLMRDEVMEARSRGEVAVEVLKALGRCVRVTPEWAVMWAYRREILEVLCGLSSSINNNDCSKGDVKLSDTDDTESKGDLDLSTEGNVEVDQINVTSTKLGQDVSIKDELTLTEACLRENSKAYAVWHHRAWVMEHDQNPNWTHELELCNKALEIDGRNFHCWDYRRFVVEKGGIDRSEELTFTDKKINKDMSDYSSWHYRRSLLAEESMDVDVELDLVNNAVFTDPSDQSPWFYLRWLITCHKKEAFLREMYVSKSLESVVLIFSESVSKSLVEQYVVKVTHSDGQSSTSGGEALLGLVKSLALNGGHVSDNVSAQLSLTPAVPEALSSVWLISLSDIDISRDFSVEARSLNDECFLWQCHLPPSSQESLIRVDTDIHRMLCDNVNNSVSNATLSQELAVVRDLLEMEPGNKWSLLAVVSLLRLLSPLESRQEILDIFLHRLPTIDPLRARYYCDAASKFTLECHLITLYRSHLRHVNMSSHSLTSLSHLPWMTLMTHIDLSRNSLSLLPDLFRHYLLCLAHLDLSHNRIQSLAPLKGLRSLQHLDVSNNLVATFRDLEPVLYCIKLVHLNIKHNLVSQLPNLTDLVTSHPTSKLHIGSLSIIYDKNL